MFTDGRRISGGLLAAGCAGALLVPLAVPAQAAEIDLEARMHSTTAFPNARGHAEFENENSGNEFEISIAGVRALAGTRVIVRVHGDFVGRMTVGPLGRAHMDKHSGVPSMTEGNVVRVRTGGGRLVTSGTLHRDLD
jgi:hypothetical protein